MSLKDFLFGVRRIETETPKENGAAQPAQMHELARFINVGTRGTDLPLRYVKVELADLERAGGLEGKHCDLVEKFLEIAERKVSVLDDYGDENWEALPEEIHKCLTKITKREQSIDVSKMSKKSQFPSHIGEFFRAYNKPYARYLAASLNVRFRAYHETRKKSSAAAQDISALSGVDFETYVAKLLREAGFESVVGTPATGDQGADLLAKKNGRTIAIQAKRYMGSVGNRAVQEIVGALRFYRADEGWVVTNSMFTASARVLAQANSIRLIDGNDLKDLAVLKARL